jgi:hypothetical protein
VDLVSLDVIQEGTISSVEIEYGSSAYEPDAIGTGSFNKRRKFALASRTYVTIYLAGAPAGAPQPSRA